MRKFLKILIPVVVLVIVLIIAGYIALRSFLTPSSMRSIAQRMASEAMQRPVEIGSVGLRFGFKIGITVQDISVPNIKGFTKGPMMEIDKTFLNLSLLPLFSRRIVINSIELEKIELNLERNENEELNLAGLVPRESKGIGWSVSLSNIRIKKGKLHYSDAITHAEYAIDDINQSISFRRHSIAISGRLNANLPSERGLPELDIRLSNDIEYDTLTRDINVRRITIDTRPLELRLRGAVEKSSALDLDGTLRIDDLSRLKNMIPPDARPDMIEGAIKSDFSLSGTLQQPAVNGQLEISKVKFLLKGMERPIERINGKLMFEHTSIKNIGIEGYVGNTIFKISGSVSDIISKNAILNITAGLDGNLSDFQGMTKDMKEIKLDGAVSSKVSIKGKTSKPQYSGDVKISGGLIDGIGLGKPISNMYFNGRFQEDALKVTACRGEIGRSDFSFSGQLVNFNKPTIQIDNRSKYLDLDELMPKTKQGKTTQGKSAPVTLNGSLHINRLTGMDMEFKNVDAEFQYKNGVIDVKNGRAQSFDGDVYLDFYYDANNPEPYRISTRMQSVSAEKILQRLLKFNRLKGKLSGKVNFQGRGLDQKSVVSNLDGVGNVVVTQGAFNNFVLLSELLSWLGLKDYKNVEFNDFRCAFAIEKGKADVKDWTMSSRVGDFLTSGTIGLDGNLDLHVALTLSQQNSNIVKKYHGDWIFFTDNKGRTIVDIITKGKMGAPRFSLDQDRVKQRIKGNIKNEFDQKIKEFESKLKDMLKGFKP